MYIQKKDSLSYVLILNYNNAEDTIACIESVLRSCSYEKVHIVVIDNASSDNSTVVIQNWLYIKSLEFSKVFYKNISNTFEVEEITQSNFTFISADVNNGYASGNNIGLRYALNSSKEEDFVWILNNDTIILEGTLGNLIKCYKELENHNIALLGTKILNEDLTLQSIGTPINKSLKKEFQEENIIEVENISGCSIFFKLDIIDEIGFMPEEYFLYYEETDWMKSIRAKKFKIFTSLTSFVVHKHAKSTGGVYSPFVIYYMTRNQILFHRKYLNKNRFILFVVKIIFRNILKSLYYIFKNIKVSMAIVIGTKDGVLNIQGKKKS